MSNDHSRDEIAQLRASWDEIQLGKFKKELTQLLNKYSWENTSNTPDFILAEYLIRCLSVLENTVLDRDQWWNINPWKNKLTKPLKDAD